MKTTSLQIEINKILRKNVATGFEEEYFPREYSREASGNFEGRFPTRN
jgi:hypothetical protein